MKFRERKVSSENSLPFIKLEDGQTIQGSFAGEPFEFYQHWKDNRSVICPGKEECSKCKEGDKGSFRFRINFIVRESGGITAKVFEQGGKVYDYLRDLDQEYEGLEKIPVKITRKGTGKNTSYVILPQQAFTLKAIQEIAKVPLHALAPTAPAEQVVEETEDDLPF